MRPTDCNHDDKGGEPAPLKLLTARSIKWNAIDRVASQLIYAVTGVVLANILSEEDFGLVGVLLIFQAFATILTDSGFGAALLRKKDPTEEDYSTVFWFNLLVSMALYWILWGCAHPISRLFHDMRLVALSKVMFISFVVNGLAIVQTNMMMKQMNVKPIAIANTIGLTVSGMIGIILAINGAGAWAIVWQTVSLAIVKTSAIWIAGHWRPRTWMRLNSLKQIWRIGASVLTSSILNTICLQLYNIVIGAYYKTLASLGIYTQADKWSKMGSASISQILTSSFVPLLARVQDNSGTFRRYMTKINRFSAFILFPFLGGLAAIGIPLFHTLFGDKWDAAIPLFRILCIRGIFVVITSLHVNYLLALGKAATLIAVETIKDALMIAAILCTIWFNSLELLVWGQFFASLLTWLTVTIITSRNTGYSFSKMMADNTPFLLATIAMAFVALTAGGLFIHPLVILCVEIAAGAATYVATLWMARVPELKEASSYLLGRFRRN